MAETTDNKVAGVALSRQDVLQELYARYNRSLHLFVRNIVKCHATAEEIAQETFVRLASNKAAGEIEYPKAYLFRSAKNIAIDHLRRKGLRVVDDNAEVDSDAVASSGPTPEDNMVHVQAKKQLEAALKELPPRTRRVFYYRRYEGRSVKDVAAVMQMSERLVYKSMEDAMQHLTLRLKGKN